MFTTAEEESRARLVADDRSLMRWRMLVSLSRVAIDERLPTDNAVLEDALDDEGVHSFRVRLSSVGSVRGGSAACRRASISIEEEVREVLWRVEPSSGAPSVLLLNSRYASMLSNERSMEKGFI